jgi:3-oxoacyl-(acyl-carrier-protein) synthase
VFGDHADKLAVSSTKSMHGHVLGGAGAVEAVCTLLAMRHQVAPPTANFTEPDPECDLNYVPNEAQPRRIRGALSNSFAFGGLNAVLAFREYTPA